MVFPACGSQRSFLNRQLFLTPNCNRHAAKMLAPPRQDGSEGWMAPLRGDFAECALLGSARGGDDANQMRSNCCSSNGSSGGVKTGVEWCTRVAQFCKGVVTEWFTRVFHANFTIVFYTWMPRKHELGCVHGRHVVASTGFHVVILLWSTLPLYILAPLRL